MHKYKGRNKERVSKPHSVINLSSPPHPFLSLRKATEQDYKIKYRTLEENRKVAFIKNRRSNALGIFLWIRTILKWFRHNSPLLFIRIFVWTGLITVT